MVQTKGVLRLPTHACLGPDHALSPTRYKYVDPRSATPVIENDTSPRYSTGAHNKIPPPPPHFICAHKGHSPANYTNSVFTHTTALAPCARAPRVTHNSPKSFMQSRQLFLMFVASHQSPARRYRKIRSSFLHFRRNLENWSILLHVIAHCLSYQYRPTQQSNVGGGAEIIRDSSRIYIHDVPTSVFFILR